MKTIRSIPAIIGAALVMAAAFVTPGMAGQKNVLPGVKGYNFNASPDKLRRLISVFFFTFLIKQKRLVH